MPRRRTAKAKPSARQIAVRIVGATGLLFLVCSSGIHWVFGPRLWWRVPCWVTVNGRLAREVTVYRSGEGTLLIDMRHAPARADNEGGGYLLQPYWRRLRALSSGYYAIHGPLAIVREMWMPSVEISLDNELMKADPKIETAQDHVSFEGLDHDLVIVHGDLLLPWPG